MKDEDKTREQLIIELARLRRQNARLKSSAKKNGNMMHVLSAFVDNLPEAIFATDLNGRITFVNRSLERLSGYSRSELPGKSPAVMCGEKESGNIQKMAARLKMNQRWRRVINQKRKDGSIYLEERVISWHSVRLKGDRGANIGTVAFGRDVAGQKRAESELRESEELLHLINDNMLDMICLTDAGFVVQYANPAFTLNLGVARSDMVGKSMLDRVHPDDITAVMSAVDMAMITKSRSKAVFRCRHASGSYLWLESNGNVITDQNQNIVGAVFASRDITDRKRVEEALWDSQNRYEALLKALPVGLFQANGNGLCVYTNEETSKILGLTHDQMSGYKWMDALHPGDREGVKAEWQRCSAQKEIFRMEYRFVRPDGKTVWVLGQAAPYLGYNSEPVWFVGTLSDITERKLAEEVQRNNERFLSNIFESIHDRISIIDTGFNIIRTNRKVEQSFRHALPLVGKKCYSVYHGNDHVCEGCPSAITLKSGQSAHAIIPVRNQGGKITGWLDHYCYPFMDIATGELKGVIVYARDITKKIRMEQEMARLERFHLIGQMAAGIGHELRNPMTAVRGFLQLLGAKGEYSRHKEYFTLMINELDRANYIINEYLSLARNKPVNLVEQNLNSILEALSPLISAEAVSAGMDVTIETGDVPGILLNKNEIRQLILNLVKNGLEAMKPGGNLLIKTFSGNGEVVLLVGDQGPGIKPDLLEKIGTPFLTTKDKGTGLGLAVCYGIASRHNAVITVETGPTGTNFFVRFK